MHILNTIKKVRDDLVFELDALCEGKPAWSQLKTDQIAALDSIIKLLSPMVPIQEQLDAMLDARLEVEMDRQDRIDAAKESYLDASKGS